MSYQFIDPARMNGVLDTGIDISATGMTIALFLKYANHAEQNEYFISLGVNLDQWDFDAILGSTIADRYTGIMRNAANTIEDYRVVDAPSAGGYDGLWHGLVSTNAISEASRRLRVQTYPNVQTKTTSLITSALTKIGVGCSPSEIARIANAKVAEVAMWNTVLSQSQIENYMAGVAASDIAADNLRGYWPLSDNDGSSIPNDGLDTGGVLTVTSATYDGADHPIITSGDVSQLSMGGVIVHP